MLGYGDHAENAEVIEGHANGVSPSVSNEGREADVEKMASEAK